MSQVRIKLAQLASAVQVAGYSTRVNNNTAVIVWDQEDEVLFVTSRARKNSNGKYEKVIIPLDAVIFMEPMDDDDMLKEMELEEAKKAKPPAPSLQGAKAAMAAAPRINDTVVMRKDKSGKIVEMSAADAKKLDAVADDADDA